MRSRGGSVESATWTSTPGGREQPAGWNGLCRRFRKSVISRRRIDGVRFASVVQISLRFVVEKGVSYLGYTWFYRTIWIR